MKTFICGILTFIILTSFVTINAVTVCEHATELITALETLPSEPDNSRTEEIIDLWLEYENIFSLTVSHTITDQIEIALCNLQNSRDEYALISARDVLLVLLHDMKTSATPALSRIL